MAFSDFLVFSEFTPTGLLTALCLFQLFVLFFTIFSCGVNIHAFKYNIFFVHVLYLFIVRLVVIL